MQNLIKLLCQSQLTSLDEIREIISFRNPTMTFESLLDYQNEQTGDSFVLYAARCGNLNLIQIINEKYPTKIGSVNRDGKNALHEACQNSHLECVKYLVESAKLDLNALRKGDWTPLMLACTKQQNKGIIEYLLSWGERVDVLRCNKDGWSAFQIAVSVSHSFGREGNLKIVEMLLKHEPKLAFELKSRNGRTPAHTASLHGHLAILKCLIQFDQGKVEKILDTRDNCGNTVMMDAILANNLEIVQYLIENFEKYVNIFDRDLLGNSSMHLIFQTGSDRVFNYIFDYYFNKSKTHSALELICIFSDDLNQFNMTPLHSACKNNSPLIVDLFLKRVFEIAAEDDQQSIHERVLKLFQQKDSHGRSATDIIRASVKLKENNSIYQNYSFLSKYIT